MSSNIGKNRLNKRQFLKTSAMTLASLPLSSRISLAENSWDAVIIGAGTAGLAASIFAAERGARVLVIESSHRIGGTLDRSSGQMSAAGTSLQKAKGIKDTPEDHFQDVMRISKGMANPEMVKVAVDNAADTIEWLLNLGWQALPEHPIKGQGHEDYLIPRYQWGSEGGMSIYRVLLPLILKLISEEKLVILTETKVSSLLQNNNEEIIGVKTQTPEGKNIDYNSSNIVITTGGSGGDSKMFEELNGSPLYARWAYPYNKGEGVKLGLSVGGYVRGKEHYLCNDGGILLDTNYPSPILAQPMTNPKYRLPWEIYVNAQGNRFVQEAHPSVDVREHAVLKQLHQRYWVIFDKQILEDSPPFVNGWSKEEIKKGFGKHHMFTSGNSLEELAEWSGINKTNLINTVKKFNINQKKGTDPDFGRTHIPLPIQEPPFYAIRLQGFAILVFGGLAVDTSLKVIQKNGKPIKNLYAAGEVLGKATFTGSAYVGGMSLTPALTLGRLLGQKILKFNS